MSEERRVTIDELCFICDTKWTLITRQPQECSLDCGAEENDEGRVCPEHGWHAYEDDKVECERCGAVGYVVVDDYAAVIGYDEDTPHNIACREKHFGPGSVVGFVSRKIANLRRQSVDHQNCATLASNSGCFDTAETHQNLARTCDERASELEGWLREQPELDVANRMLEMLRVLVDSVPSDTVLVQHARQAGKSFALDYLAATRRLIHEVELIRKRVTTNTGTNDETTKGEDSGKEKEDNEESEANEEARKARDESEGLPKGFKEDGI